MPPRARRKPDPEKEAQKRKLQEALLNDVSEWRAGIIVHPNEDYYNPNLVRELQRDAHPLPYGGGFWRIKKSQDKNSAWSVTSYASGDPKNPIGETKVLPLGFRANVAAEQLHISSTAEIYEKGFDFFKNKIEPSRNHRFHLCSLNTYMSDQGGLAAWFDDAKESEQSRNSFLSKGGLGATRSISKLKDFYENIGVLESKSLVVADADHLRRIVNSWKDSEEGKKEREYTTRQVNDAVIQEVKREKTRSYQRTMDKLNKRMNFLGLPLYEATEKDENAVCAGLTSDDVKKNYGFAVKALRKFCREEIAYGPQTAEEKIRYEAKVNLIDLVSKWRNGDDIPANQVNDAIIQYFNVRYVNAQYREMANKLNNQMNGQGLELWEVTKKDAVVVSAGITQIQHKELYSSALNTLRKLCKEIGYGPMVDQRVRFAVPSDERPNAEVQREGYNSLKPSEEMSGNVISFFFQEWNTYNQYIPHAEGQDDVYFVSPAEMHTLGLDPTVDGFGKFDDRLGDFLAALTSDERRIQRLVFPINNGNKTWSIAEYNRVTGESHHVDAGVRGVADAKRILSYLNAQDTAAKLTWGNQEPSFFNHLIQEREDIFASGRRVLGTAAGIQDRRNGENDDFHLQNSIPFALVTLREHLAFSILCDFMNAEEKSSRFPIQHNLSRYEVEPLPNPRIGDNGGGACLRIYDKKSKTIGDAPSGDGQTVSSEGIRAAGLDISDFIEFERFDRAKIKRNKISHAAGSISSLEPSRARESATTDSLALSQPGSFSWDVASTSLFSDAESSDWQWRSDGVPATNSPAALTSELGDFDFDANLGAWEHDYHDVMMSDAQDSELGAFEYSELEVHGDHDTAPGVYRTEGSPLTGAMDGVDWFLPQKTNCNDDFRLQQEASYEAGGIQDTQMEIYQPRSRGFNGEEGGRSFEELLSECAYASFDYGLLEQGTPQMDIDPVGGHGQLSPQQAFVNPQALQLQQSSLGDDPAAPQTPLQAGMSPTTDISGPSREVSPAADSSSDASSELESLPGTPILNEPNSHLRDQSLGRITPIEGSTRSEQRKFVAAMKASLESSGRGRKTQSAQGATGITPPMGRGRGARGRG